MITNIARTAVVWLFHWRLIIFGASLLLLHVALQQSAPVNYLRMAPNDPASGWNLSEVERAGDVPFADTSTRATRFIASGKDGSLSRRSGMLPPGPAVLSVYLRSNEHTSLKLFGEAPNHPSSTIVTFARVTPEWKRFTVLMRDHPGGAVTFRIGGNKRFTSGELIEVAKPQVERGLHATSYRDADGALTAFNQLAEDWQLRTAEKTILLIGWLLIAIGAISHGPGRRYVVSCFIWAGRPVLAGLRRRRRMITIVGVYACIVGATVVTAEVISYVSLMVMLGLGQESLSETAERVWAKGWSLPLEGWNARSGVAADYGFFSPLTQVRRLADRQTGQGERSPAVISPFFSNHLGLVENEGNLEALDIMPEKPPGMIRIIVYGGSTALGIGVRDGAETITGQLERMLNRRAIPGAVFQVLNFGHSASNAYSDLQFMVSMGSYLRPDVSILFNGFNDAFFATELSVAKERYVINWADFSYKFNDVFNGLQPAPARIPFLPFSSLLANELVTEKKLAERQAFYDAMPMRVISKWFDSSGRHRSALVGQTLRFTAGYFVGRQETLLSYLQPHPVQFRKLNTTPSDFDYGQGGTTEETRVKEMVARCCLTKVPYDEYRQRMASMFDGYASEYRRLTAEYASYPNIKFSDIRDIFQGSPDTVYIDFIHYTAAGQKILAERMFKDLLTVPAMRSNLRPTN